MSYKAFNSLKNHVEIEFLKSCSYEKINEMMNQLNDKIKKLEEKNKELQYVIDCLRGDAYGN